MILLFGFVPLVGLHWKYFPHTDNCPWKPESLGKITMNPSKWRHNGRGRIHVQWRVKKFPNFLYASDSARAKPFTRRFCILYHDSLRAQWPLEFYPAVVHPLCGGFINAHYCPGRFKLSCTNKQIQWGQKYL